MKKDTSRIVEELKECSDFKKFYSENADNILNADLPEYLQKTVSEKGLSKSAVIKASQLSEIYGYQIFSGVRHPERSKLLALTVGMGLDLDETQRLLRATGYPELYVKHGFDAIVMFGICKRLSVMEINEILYDYGEITLG